MKANRIILTSAGLALLTLLLLLYRTVKPVHLDDFIALPLKHHDSISWKLINIQFKYVLQNANLCNETDEILAIIIVTSYFSNMETRRAMRRAFNTEDLNKFKLRRVFLLGEEKKDKFFTQQSVINEHDSFKDIIQGNFSEAYRNLSYKHVMGLKWASTFCSNAKYIIKMDDDIVINMYNLNLILEPLKNVKNDFIAGYVLHNLTAIRNPSNKWYVTTKEYPLNNYPSFVSGWFYVTKPMAVQRIVALSSYEQYFWIDDVFVTGILAKKLNIKLFDISKYFAVNSEFLQCCLQDLKNNIDCDIIIGPNGGDTNMFYSFNNNIQKCFKNKCQKRKKLINETCVAERKINLGRGNAIISDFRLI